MADEADFESQSYKEFKENMERKVREDNLKFLEDEVKRSWSHTKDNPRKTTINDLYIKDEVKNASGWLKFFEVAKPFVTALYFAGMAGMIVTNPNPWTVGGLIFFAVLMIEVHFMGIKKHLKEMGKTK